MAVLKKTLFPENLDKYSVLLQDTDPNSKYFKITELPDTFTGGKNAFLIQGSEFLVADTLVKIEIKDAKGNIIYHEPGEGIPEYYEGTSKVIAVYIYPDTAFGPCTITILGEVSEYVDANGIRQPVPLQYKDTYNVRWQKQINVNPFLQNNTKIRFYRRPEVEIAEVLKPVFTITETQIQDQGYAGLEPNQPMDFELNYYNGIPILPDDFQYYMDIQSSNLSFTQNMLGQTVIFPSYPTYTPTITEIVSSNRATLSEPLIEFNYIRTVVATPYRITYISGSDKVESQFTSSYANIKLTNLETFAGDVKRVKVFRRSKGSISDYELVQDILLESNELLFTLDGGSKAVQPTGIFDSEILSKYWVTDGSLTATLSNSRLSNGVKLNGAGKFKYSSSLDLTAKTVYELQFDAFYSSSTESNLDIYISGSSHTNSSSIDELKIGTLKGIIPTKKFENEIVQFRLDVNEPTASLYFSASQGEWHLSDVSLVVSAETAFSPDSVTFLTSVPTSVPNEIFEFKFEFYDVNNNYVPVTIFKEKQFVGGTNTVIVLTQIASSSAEISSSLLAVSASISGTITVNSSSAYTTINTVSGSLSGSIFSLSGSVSGTIGSVSASVSGTIGQVSSSVSGTIGSVSGSISGTIGQVSSSVSGTIGQVSGSISGSIYTLSGSVSGSIANVSSSISSSLATANSQSLYTVFSASAYLDKFIFTDENGKIRRPPTASAAGLYTGDDHLGFYSAGSWKTYMDNQGDFYLTSSVVGGGFLAWSSAQSRLQIQGDINIQGGNAATNASLSQSFTNVSGAINSATSSLSQSVASTTFTTATGLIAKPPTVLVGSTSGLYLGNSFLGYYDGNGWKTFMANNGNFYLSGSGGDSLTWAGGVLSINGAINITGGNAATSAALTSSLSSTLSSANSTAAGYAANAALSASISGSVNASGQITKPATPSGAGLYLGSSYLGYYNGSAWKTYMENTGNFYLSGTGTDSLTWNGSTLTINGAITVTGGNAATTTQVNTAASNAVTSGSNAAANAVTSGSVSAAAAQTAAQLFATSIGNNAVLSGSAAASAAQTAAINQAKTDASASVNLLANGNWTGGNGTFITSTSISSPIIAGNAGYISGIFVVGDGGSIVLDGRTAQKKIYIGTGDYANSNTSFYVDNTGQFSLKDKLTWDGTTLTVNGAINITGGSAVTQIQNAALSGSNAQTTANAASTAAGNAQTTANTANTTANAAQSQLTAIGSQSGSWVNPSNYNFGGTGFALANAAPSGNGLYLGADYLGYYKSGFGWKTYMDNSGNFGLQGTAGYLTWTAATDTLAVKGDITATNITATNTGNIAGWNVTSDALTKSTGSYTLRLSSNTAGPEVAIRKSNSIDYLDVIQINANQTVPALVPSNTGSIGYDCNGRFIANVLAGTGIAHDSIYMSGSSDTNRTLNDISLGLGGCGTATFGYLGFIYAEEEIWVEESDVSSKLSNIINEVLYDPADIVEVYYSVKLRAREYGTNTSNACNQTGELSDEYAVIMDRYVQLDQNGEIFNYTNYYGGTLKAQGGGGINTGGTGRWYYIEMVITYDVYWPSVGNNSSGVQIRYPSGVIPVKYGRVGNGYSIFSPGGFQVYQGVRNYINAASVANKTDQYDYELQSGGGGVNFFEVKGKTGIYGSLTTTGFITSGKAKAFKITHPLDESKWLYHTATESPEAGVQYRGRCDLIDGFASCSIDSVSRMTEGTFEALTKNTQVFLQNETGFDRVRGKVISGSVHIWCENQNSTDTISWFVTAERKDKDVAESSMYNSMGYYQPEKPKNDQIIQSIKDLKNKVANANI